MKTFWVFRPWLPHWLNAGHLSGRCEFLNGMELVRARPVDGEFLRNELPTLQIKFAAEDFDPDCFDWNRFTLVSEKMRHAMALGPSDIQYFDVDSSRAAPLPRSKRYQIMHVPVAEDVSDPERSDYTLRHRPEGIQLFGFPGAIAFRPDAEPDHEIFYDRFFKVAFCTDAFALRVLQAGCTGMRFLDPADLRGWKRFRTLRGVEESEWDPKRKSFRDKLIREIP
jgi:uncharacterized protein DUF1629